MGWACPEADSLVRTPSAKKGDNKNMFVDLVLQLPDVEIFCISEMLYNQKTNQQKIPSGYIIYFNTDIGKVSSAFLIAENVFKQCKLSRYSSVITKLSLKLNCQFMPILYERYYCESLR